MQDGRWDPEQLERGYRYFKALERRGDVVRVVVGGARKIT